MNKNLIGNENLPNTYIDRIIINKLTESKSKNLSLSLTICVYDAIKSRITGKPYFSAFKRLPRKKILVVVSNSETFTNNILKGVEKFNEQHLSKIEGYSKDLVHIRYISATKQHLRNKEKKLSYNLKMKNMKKPTGHIAVFTCVVESYSNSTYNGPINCELVMSGGEVVQQSFFYTDKRTGELWYGPVHGHGNNYMAGSFHSNKPHSQLNRTLTINTKVSDNRNDKVKATFTDSRKNKKIFKNYHISDLKHTQNSLLGFNYSFEINTRQICKDYFLYNISDNKKDEIINEVISNCKISNITVFYKKYKKDNYKLTSRSKQIEEQLIPFKDKSDTGILNSSLKEIIINENIERKNYVGLINDNMVKNVKVLLEVKNPFIKYFNNLNNTFKRSIANLTLYKNLLNSKNNYDMNNHTTSKSFMINTYNRKEFWLEPIKNYKKLLMLCTNKTKQEVSIEAKNMFDYLNPKSVTKISIQKAIENFSLYMNLYLKKYNVSMPNRFSRSKRKNNTKDKVIIKKEYQVNFKAKKKTISYIPSSIDGDISIITASTLRSLLTSNLERYEISNNQNPVFDSLVSENNRDRLYMGPIQVTTKKETIQIENFNNIKEENMEKFVENSNDDLIDNESFSGLYVTKYRENNNVLVDPIKQFGEDSPFQTNLDLSSKTFSPTSNIFRNNKSLSKRRAKVPNDIQYYKTEQNEFLKNKTQRYIDNIPVQIKDLISKPRIMNKDKNDFLSENLYTKSLLYENLCTVYFNPEEKSNSNGEVVLNYNNRQKMNLSDLESIDRPYICQLDRYDLEELSDGYNEFESYVITNSIFIVVPDDWNFSRNFVNLEQTNKDIEGLYATVLDTIEYPNIAMRSTNVVQTKNRMRHLGTPTQNQRRSTRPQRQAQQQTQRQAQRQMSPRRSATRIRRGGY